MKIAVLPGDGIGKEIVAETLKVLGRLALKFEFEEAPVGGAGYEAAGHPLPEKTLALATIYRDQESLQFERLLERRDITRLYPPRHRDKGTGHRACLIG